MKKRRNDAWDTPLTEAQRWDAYERSKGVPWPTFAAWLTKEYGLNVGKTAIYEWQAWMRRQEGAHRLEHAIAARQELQGLSDYAALDARTADAYLALANDAILSGDPDVMRLISQSGGDLFSGIVAVTQVTEPGPVREELVLLRNEVAFGTSLPAALNHVAERVGTPEATAVFTTLAQSIEMGTSVSDNLRSASELIRRQARSRAQERAQKAVVNMSFPLLLLILPGVFIVLLAPLVIQFLASR